jgi:hypothetical protein
MGHATVRRARIRFYDDALEVWGLRPIGWQAFCRCGWEGAERKTRDEAKADGREHRCADNAA